MDLKDQSNEFFPIEPASRSPFFTGKNLQTFSSLNYPFNVKFYLNPLVSTAAPIIVWATHFRDEPVQPDMHNLIQQIKNFENNLFALGYRSQIILAARYLLCAYLDEITQSRMKQTQSPSQNLLSTFQREEEWGGEHFFTILTRSAETPKEYIEVLELGYLCLSLGYKGKYRKLEEPFELQTFTDKIYQLIRVVRGELTKSLIISTPSKQTKRYNWNMFSWLPPIWLAILVIAIALPSIFFPYYQHLKRFSAPIFEMSQKIIQMNQM